MLGAIAGDIIGSPYERRPHTSTDFPLFGPDSTFTDDTVLTAAIAHSILTGCDYREALLDFANRYPHRGYGGRFKNWVRLGGPGPYNSLGNGSAMRVSPVGFAFDSLEEVLREARRSAAVTHDHPEGIKGAQATATAVFLARTGSTRDQIRQSIEEIVGYDLSTPIDEIRPTYRFDVTCQGSVPQAIICFLQSSDFEDAVRKAVSLGGDSDTQAAIAGGIAQAFYGGVPVPIAAAAMARLDDHLRSVVTQFRQKYGC